MNLTQILKKSTGTHTQKQIIITLIKKNLLTDTPHTKVNVFNVFGAKYEKVPYCFDLPFWHLSFNGGKIQKFEFCNKKL